MASVGGSEPARIGLLGGSFNPPHRGHVTIALTVLRQLGLDRVVLVPSARPPHKDEGELASGADRVRMATLAVADEPRLEVSEIEFERDGPSYTIDLVRAFRERVPPETRLVFVIGADSLHDLPTWRKAATLVREVELAVVGRPGFDLDAELRRLGEVFGAAWVAATRERVVPMEPIGLSSTEIRVRIARGEDVTDAVVPAVIEFIRERALYGASPAPRTP